ncbi:hypothetical protein BCR42DRAFT_425385 [Absidia repens]|uniref:Uncharacterized protein n=1 Tax=Absidia repens TaxID=90262 RepID=A0A1X2I4C6_9FUNG|nr:hypothetical protein BCR42DRAFT_425385 [Absidia repens]
MLIDLKLLKKGNPGVEICIRFNISLFGQVYVSTLVFYLSLLSIAQSTAMPKQMQVVM